MKRIFRTFVLTILIISLILTGMIFARAVEVSTAADFISQINGTATEITITRDLTLTSSVTIKRSVKINGGSNTITLNYSGDDIIFNGSGTIEINGGVWKDDDGQDTFYSNSFTGTIKFTNKATITGGLPINFGVNAAGTLVIDGAVLESTGHAIKNQGATTVQILSGSLTVSGTTGSNAYYSSGDTKGALTVGRPDGTGPTLTATNTSTSESLIYLNAKVDTLNHTIYSGTFIHKGKGKVVGMGKKASVNIQGGTFTANAGQTFNIYSNSTVNISGGTFSSASNNVLYVNSGAKVNISGGNFNKGSASAVSGSGSLSITGGTYNFNPSSYVNTTEYKVVESNSKWIVMEKKGVDVRTESEFLTAIANKEEIINIVANFPLTSERTINYSVIINGNGCTLSQSRLYIKGSGNVTLNNLNFVRSADCLKVDETVNLTIIGGEYNCTNTSGNEGSICVANSFKGTLTLTGDVLLTSTRFAIYGGSGTANNGTINFEHCRIESSCTAGAVKWQSGHTVNIGGAGKPVSITHTGGGTAIIFTERATTTVNIYEDVVITGGTPISIDSPNGNPTVNIYGGTFTATDNAVININQPTKVNISGGTFSAEEDFPIINTKAGISSGALNVNGTNGNIKIESDSMLLLHNSTFSTTITDLNLEQDSTVINVSSTGGDITLSNCNLISNNDTIISASSTSAIFLNDNTTITSTGGKAVNGGLTGGDGTGTTNSAGENIDLNSIAVLLKGGDEHRYSFKVDLKPSTTYKFAYTYRSTGAIPTLEVSGDVDILSIKDRSYQMDKCVQIYHITTDNYTKKSAEYTFSFTFDENTYGVGFYIANIQLYQLKSNVITGKNILSGLNPANNESVRDVLVEEGQSVDVELNELTSNNGWFGKFNANEDNSSDYSKYIRVGEEFFKVTTKAEKNTKLVDLRKVLLGVKEVDLNLNYDEHCDGVISIQDLLRLKKAIDSDQTPPISIGEDLSDLKPNEIPAVNFGTVSSFIQDDRHIKLVNNATLSNYNSYIESLKNNGFYLYDQNTNENNVFATFINEATTVTVYFMPNESNIRIIAEPKITLHPRQQDNNYQSKNITTLLTGLNVSTQAINKEAKEGMCFIIRLDDGSFIIIDGGQAGYSDYDADNILNTMKAQSPAGTEKFTIAAWIFTHCHGDHVGGFDTFSILYHDKVNIEAFYYNFPTDEGIRTAAPYMFDNTNFRYNQFKVCMRDYYPDVPKIRPHTGEKIYIRNAVIEMLFTYENHFPKVYENGDFGQELNDSSMIFKMDIEGQSILFTGDADDGGMNFATKNYGSYLKSDIFQMPHHGMNGVKTFFQGVDPIYAFLPYSTSPDHYNRFINASTADSKSKEANQWLIKDSTTLRQMIDLAHGNVTIPLPYNPADSEIYQRIPDLSNYRYKDYSYLY